MISKQYSRIFKNVHASKRFFATESLKLERDKDEYYKNLAAQSSEDDSKPQGWAEAKPFKNIPGPRPVPIFGNNLKFMKGGDFFELPLHDFNTRLQKEYGNIVILKGLLGRRDMVFLFDPNDVETMLRNEGARPLRYGLPSFVHYRTRTRKEIFQDVGGVLTVQGEEWFKLRSKVNPILMQPRTALHYVGSMDLIATELLDKIRLLSAQNDDGQLPDNFINELYKWALESMGMLALNKHLGCLKPDLEPNSETQIFINSVLKMFEYMYKLDVLPSAWKYFSTKTWREYIKILDILTFTSLKHIDQALETNDDSLGDLSILKRLAMLDRKVAVAMIMDMLVAGVDTTGRTMGAALYFLARYPEKQEKLREEVLRLLPSKNSSVTKETLSSAPYLKAVIKETTRMAPIATGNLRTCVKNLVLAGYQIPKGTDLIASNMFLSNHENYVQEPKKFLPERWLRNNEDELSAKHMHPFVHLPFGFGPRSCIGKRLANLELEVGLLKILRNFELSWPHADMKFGSKLLYGVEGPLKLRIKEIL